jgi:exopolyphosphatase/guanosine-5'-triphosphate,3'-diphosphate pyrophosphatase
MEAATREVLASQPLEPHPELCGLAGTATTTAALLLGLDHYDRDRVDGTRHHRDALVRLRDELASETQAERLHRGCLEPGRADVIVAGLAILVAALDHAVADTFVVRDRGLRYALL